ncbi:hypothetical protein SODALDRAFT_320517 [Sodiomyces alkalinus F11]|uniref:Cyclic-AMP phosphodiesterase n=1 Tax=Sodiomyces alkalinus (strain CBS 110278 / VKM F-3762 / F11) TaxID=1314773 RepID=A0A3N2PNF2_SODAK|nr:hypothetical protein SODALDRAFT_320517 [Sodiomyces alkalinus F11]ROT36061.1 hypothetical protein SODALDRAFT_320517 [Sodiomyces alkalinus F11]
MVMGESRNGHRDAAADAEMASMPTTDSGGAGGGPLENNTTAFLVRAVAAGWQKCSVVAVDAGVHLAAIVQILESTQPANLASLPLPHTLESGPFAGFQVHSASTRVNAAHIARSLVDTYLITHPHLDHIAGFVVNTAGVPGGPRPKRLAGLPATIDAFKQHIFNNVIWPNLSDENGGVGLVTYTRLVDGGSPAIGEGDARGYLEVAEGLSVKAWSISHGTAIEPLPPHRNSQSSATSTPARHASLDASSSMPSHYTQTYHPYAQQQQQQQQPHHHHHHHNNHHHHQQQPQPHIPPRSHNHNPPATPQPRTASCPFLIQQQQQQANFLDAPPPAPPPPVYDSTVYFLRDTTTGSEVLIFGDVEPDALSSYPRNLGIWKEAAPKIARGALRAVLIECSYDDSQSADRLFGHMKPSFVMDELRTLAREVDVLRCLWNAGSSSDSGLVGKEAALAAAAAAAATTTTTAATAATTSAGRGGGGLDSLKKRKRLQVDCDAPSRRKTGPVFNSGGCGGGGEGVKGVDSEAVSPKTVRSRFNSQQDDGVGVPQQQQQQQQHSLPGTPHLATPTAELSLKDVVARDLELASRSHSPSPRHSFDDGRETGEPNAAVSGTTTRPLEGVKVIIIHVKDKLDGVDQGARILKELQAHEDEAQTGVGQADGNWTWFNGTRRAWSFAFLLCGLVSVI